MHLGTEATIVLLLCFTLTVGAALRMLSVRTRFPYTIAMLLVGIVTGLLLEQIPAERGAVSALRFVAEGSTLSPELIVFVFLPVLIFESAFSLEVHGFRRDFGAVLTLAVPALLASTGAIALLMLGLTSFRWQWGWLEALVFAALISATDPVAVVALLREMGAPRRLGLLIEGESLLNDGTAIVVFTVLLGLLTGSFHSNLLGTFGHFLWVSVGGLAVGAALAIGTTAWLARVFNAPLIEITLTLVLAYLVMFVAEGLLHVSGVIGLVTAGLWMSGRGRVHISPEVSSFLHRFWGVLAYLANTLIFFLVGLVIAAQVRDVVLLDALVVALAFGGILAVRVGLSFLFRPLIDRVAAPLSAGETTVLAWGGLRGAVSLALALVVSQHPAVPARLGDQILLATAGVVLLTILVNGSTIGWLLRRLGFDRPPPGDRLAELMSRASVLSEVERRIGDVSEHRDLKTVNWTDVERDLQARRRSVQRQIAAIRAEIAAAAARERTRGYWRQALGIERQAYWAAFAEGTLGPQATRILDHDVDLQLDRLSRGEETPLRRHTRGPPGWRARAARWLRGPGGAFGQLQFELLALRYDLHRGEQLAAERVLADLERRAEVDADVREQIRDAYRGYLHASKERLEDLRANLPEVTRAIETRLARRIQLNFERESYEELTRLGAIDAVRGAEALAEVEHQMKALRFSARTAGLPETGELCRNAPLFAELDDAAISELASLTVERALVPGEVLFRQGERGESMFILARGAVAVIRESDGASGRPGGVLLDVLGGGEILGEMALLTGAPRVATARAITTVTVGELSRRAFERLMAAQPGLREGVWRSFAERRFDNHLRTLSRYEHLSHDDRVRWFRRGSLVALERGEALPCDDGAIAFVVVGSVAGNGTTWPEESVLPLRRGLSLRATESARVAVLPPLFEAA